MKYTRLGKRGPKVSTIGFGAWAIGGLNWGPTDDQVQENSAASDMPEILLKKR